MAKQVTNFGEYAQNIGLQGSIIPLSDHHMITGFSSFKLSSLCTYASTISPNVAFAIHQEKSHTLKSTLSCTLSKTVVQLTNKS